MDKRISWQRCETLWKQQEFEWRWVNDSKIELSSNRPSIAREKYDAAIKLLDESPQGLPMKEFVSEVFNGNTRPAYCLAAILVSEDICEYERAGRHSTLRLTGVRTAGALPDKGEKGRALPKVKSIEKHLRDFSAIQRNTTSRLNNLQSLIHESDGKFVEKIPVTLSRIESDWTEKIKDKLIKIESSGTYSFVYIFRVKKSVIARFRSAMLDARLTDEERKYSRLNEHKYDQQNMHMKKNGVIYVGSSRNKISTRIYQHLGLGPKKTYSLQLDAWASQLVKELDIYIIRFSEKTSPQALQAIEDSLWLDLLPEFGRQGAR